MRYKLAQRAVVAQPNSTESASEASSGELWVVGGCTAAGKTALSLALAEALGAEIVLADSVQVYRDFTIGSAKPSAAEQARVPHHLVDAFDPACPIDAAQFATAADRAIGEIHARQRPAVVVGGTGLWLRALLRGLVPLPKLPPELRSAISARFPATMAHAALHERDPVLAARLHPNDLVRIRRGLEVFEATGKALSAWQAEHALGQPRYAFHALLLLPAGPAFEARLRARTAAMLEAGWLDEVQALRARYGNACPLMRSVGYRELAQHLDGELSSDALPAAVLQSTRRYARRQRLWFRNEPGFSHALRLEVCANSRNSAELAELLEQARAAFRTRRTDDP